MGPLFVFPVHGRAAWCQATTQMSSPAKGNTTTGGGAGRLACGIGGGPPSPGNSSAFPETAPGMMGLQLSIPPP